jgi:hypothetical protein
MRFRTLQDRCFLAFIIVCLPALTSALLFLWDVVGTNQDGVGDGLNGVGDVVAVLTSALDHFQAQGFPHHWRLKHWLAYTPSVSRFPPAPAMDT